MKNILCLLCCFITVYVLSQNNVGINTRNPEKSSMLDVKINGDHKTVVLPHVNLQSKSDQSSINGGAPEESLLVYNTNGDIPGGKGIYYWDKEDVEWKFLVSQSNINLFRNLTKYYTAKSGNGQEIFIGTNSILATAAAAYLLDTDTTNWTMIKNPSNENLMMEIKVDQPTNFIEVNLTGTMIVTYNSILDHSIEYGYGIFVDGKLKYAKSETRTARSTCNYSNFYINTLIPNIETGTHKITFGVMIRRIRQTSDSSNTYPNNTNFKITLGGGNSSAGCNNINSFESETRATVYLNQTL